MMKAQEAASHGTSVGAVRSLPQSRPKATAEARLVMAYSVPFSARSGNSRRFIRLFTLAATAALSAGLASPALSQTLGYAGQPQGNFWSNDRSLPSPQVTPEEDTSSALPERFRRRVVSFDTREAPGTIVIDTGNTALYYVLGGGRAIRYGVGVGREGFTWSGVQNVSRKAAWPDWHPPAEMIARQPYLPRFVAGGPGNPLGAAAMYLGSSAYRIHGTNDPSTIGKFVSSGCIRLTNADVQDLFNRVSIGTKVVVLPKNKPRQIEEKLAGRGRLSMNVPPAGDLSQNIKMSGLY
jgi:lipoprotein-anchoring transpeptidase ErfK/SrfK